MAPPASNTKKALNAILAILCIGCANVDEIIPEIFQNSQIVPESAREMTDTDIVTETTTLEIININVGQGDATLIIAHHKFSPDKVVLIDAGGIPMRGNADAGAIIADRLSRRNIRKLDAVILTHYDADHIGGLVSGSRNVHGSALQNGIDKMPKSENGNWDDDVQISTIVDRGISFVPTSKTYEKYRQFTRGVNDLVHINSQQKVDDYVFDMGNGVLLTCYASNGRVRGHKKPVPRVNTENERSLCFLLSFGNFEYLIGGDTIGRTYGRENAEVESAIGVTLEANNIAIDGVHLNHHGSNNATSMEYLRLTKPEFAVLSVGNSNSYGHPHVQTLQRLAASNVYYLWQTENGAPRNRIPIDLNLSRHIKNGDVIIKTNGETYTIDNYTFRTD